jgi:hypothetical protein
MKTAGVCCCWVKNDGYNFNHESPRSGYGNIIEVMRTEASPSILVECVWKHWSSRNAIKNRAAQDKPRWKEAILLHECSF